MKTTLKTASLLISIALFFAALMGACESKPVENDSKLKVVATMFPVYDFAKAVAGGNASVTMLLTPGVESHSYDPTPKDIIDIGQASMFIYVGKTMETWVDGILSATPDNVKVVAAGDGITLFSEDDDHHDESHLDPHIWTDPTLAAKMAENIRDAFIEIDPENASQYTKNCSAFTDELMQLDEDFYTALYGTNKTICFGGRFAMRYFARRYQLNVICPYTSCGDETEPSAKAVSEVVDYMHQNSVKYLFHEELSVSSVASAIAQETGASLALLHSCHNVSKEEFDSGATYLSIMKENLANIKRAFSDD